MLIFRTLILIGCTLAAAACSGSNALTVGTPDDSFNNGSYAGSTLNSPTADQNPHVGGGDQTYSGTPSDAGKPLAPPDRADGR